MMNNPAITDAFHALSEKLQLCLHNHAQAPYSFLPASAVDAVCRQLGYDKQQLGLALLPLAAAFAEVPVSQFHVGAVAFDSAGNAYLGANFEFSDVSIGQTIHAEQSAIAHAWARGATDLALLVINYAPCGHCRQFINEVHLADDFRILLPDCPAQPLSAYLPNAFGPADLGISVRILAGNSAPPADDLAVCAKWACDNAHAPYSDSRSGVAVQFADGDIAIGRYGENAAFNPSLPPLQMALNYRRLQGKNWRAIEKVVMAEHATTLSQRANTQALLATIGADNCFDYIDVCREA